MKKGKKELGFFEKIKLDFKKTIIVSIILNILFLVFGIIIYMNPDVTLKVAGIIIGIYFMLFGVFYIYEYLTRDNSLFKFKLLLGILSFILGIFVLLDPFKLVKLLTITLGIYLIIVALSKVFEALKLKQSKYDGWVLMLVTSIILLIFGVFITINPMASMDLVEVAGIFIILASILEISNLLMTYSKAKEIVKLLKGE